MSVLEVKGLKGYKGDSEETDGCLCQRESSIPTADVLNSTFFSHAVASVTHTHTCLLYTSDAADER